MIKYPYYVYRLFDRSLRAWRDDVVAKLKGNPEVEKWVASLPRYSRGQMKGKIRETRLPKMEEMSRGTLALMALTLRGLIRSFTEPDGIDMTLAVHSFNPVYRERALRALKPEDYHLGKGWAVEKTLVSAMTGIPAGRYYVCAGGVLKDEYGNPYVPGT